MKILLLDDDTRDVPSIADVWSLSGNIIIQVTNWRDLELALKNNKFDAVLVDLMMPAIDLPTAECGAGFTTGEYIFSKYIHPALPTTPFAVFSAALIGLDVIKAADKRLRRFIGYRGYFEKGCSDEELLKAISK